MWAKSQIGENKTKVFRQALWIFWGLQAIQLFADLSLDRSTNQLSLDIAFLMVIGVILYSSKSKALASIVTFFAVALAYCFLVWSHTGGWNGNTLYTITVLVLMIAVVLNGVSLFLMLSIYAISVGLLYNNSLGFDQPYETIPNRYLEIDFFLKTVFLIVITMLHKLQFVQYRKSVEDVNQRLIESNRLQEQQQVLLSRRKEELHAIRNNLSEVVEEKVKEVKEKSSMLRTYAFKNAHEVRAPLAKILGIIHLVEMDADDETEEQMNLIKAETIRMDKILRQINDIVKSD